MNWSLPIHCAEILQISTVLSARRNGRLVFWSVTFFHRFLLRISSGRMFRTGVRIGLYRFIASRFCRFSLILSARRNGRLAFWPVSFFHRFLLRISSGRMFMTGVRIGLYRFIASRLCRFPQILSAWRNGRLVFWTVTF